MFRTSMICFTARSPVETYQHQLKIGLLKQDPHQTTIINKLDQLYYQLKHYRPSKPQPLMTALTKTNWLKRWLGQAPSPPSSPPGIYLYGTVGTGKSMLMDLFYNSIKNLPNQICSTKRIHFHQFMVDVHKMNHNLQTQLGHAAQADVLVSIARLIAEECKVLCFDEFQVTDIVDAMILKRLLESLLSYGVVVVITSNRHPDELYKNGIQRESFLGCIELIKNRMKVLDLNSGHDYRTENAQEESSRHDHNQLSTTVFLHPAHKANQAEFKLRFQTIACHSQNPVIENRQLSIWGTRSIQVPLSTNNVAWFEFHDLCNHPPLGAADYLNIVDQFQTIFVNCVPKLSIHQHDIARRFILFIDTAYEKKTKLMILSEVPIVEIFSTKEENPKAPDCNSITTEMRAAVDDLGLESKTIGESSLFSGEEERFAWARAVSRLNEMGSQQWVGEALWRSK